MKNLEIIKNKNGGYGIQDLDTGKVIIPAKYSRKEIFDIDDVENVNDVFILKGKDDSNKIVGFYDSERQILKKGNFTSYEIISNILVLKNKIEIGTKNEKTGDILKSKTYISLYDPKNGRYIDGDYYDKEILSYVTRYGYPIYMGECCRCIDQIKDVLILNSKAFYDTRTGFWQDAIICSQCNGNVAIYNPSDKMFLGYYDIEKKSFEKYTRLYCKELEDNHYSWLDLSYNGKIARYREVHYPIKEYSDFVTITIYNQFEYETRLFYKGLTILLDKICNFFLGFESKMIKIVEIKPEIVKQLGIPTEFEESVYLIDGELYTFRRAIGQGANRHIYPNFVKISSKVVGAVEYEYGIGSIEASSFAELDHKLDEIEKEKEAVSSILENLFYQDERLMEEYPKLVRKR